MTLHNDEALFEELIIAASASLGIPEVFVEKDYWVCSVLKSISQMDEEIREKVVFKGGTSLSKAHKLIERFSEDIDLAVIVDGLSQGQAKAFIKKIEKEIVNSAFSTLSEHPQISKGSRFRKTVHEYPRKISGAMGDAKEVILLEINTYTNPTPNTPQQIGTYIFDFLMDQEKEDGLIATYGLEPFEVNVLDMERTLCEKISAIARASYGTQAELQSKIRHLYDIYHLLQHPQVQEFFLSADFFEMMEIVKLDDENFRQPEDTEERVLETAPIFQSNAELLAKIRPYYNETFSTLVHGELPPFEKIEEIVGTLAQRFGEQNE